MKYRWKTKPYRHQVQAVKHLLSNEWGGALLMEPRTGKTKVAIDYASILHQAGKVNRVLIFAPLSVMGVWEDEIKAHCSHRRRVVVWDKDGRKRFSLPSFGSDILDFVIINYDALSTPGRPTQKDEYGKVIRRSRTRGGKYDVYRELERWQPQLVILDESHRIKSVTAKKTRMVHKLGKNVPYRLILTGTVVTKKKRIFDIYSQWKFLNPRRFAGLTFTDFKHQYGRWLQRDGYEQWVRNINEDELRRKIHLDAFSITRAECYDLPVRTDQPIPIKLEESAKVYDQMAEDMVARIHTGEISEASIRIVQRLRLSQITSGISKTEPTSDHPEGRTVLIGSEKLRVLEELLSDLFEADEKVVIPARFVPDIQRIQAMVEKKLKAKTWVIRGGVKRLDRDRYIKEFRAHQGAGAFIVQPQAAKEGIDLSTASIMIWYSLTTSYVDYTQMCDRIALADKPTYFMYLIAQGTVDEIALETLREDGDFAKRIMRKPELLLRDREH